MDSIISTSSILSSELIIQGRIYSNTRNIVEDWSSYSEGQISDDSNWTGIRGSFYINAEHQIRSDSSSYRTCLMRNGTFPDNQYSEIEFLNGGSSGYIGASVRCSVGVNFYGFFVSGTGDLMRIVKYVGGSYTSLALVNPAISVVKGDILRLEVTGNVLTFKVNGIVEPLIGNIIDNDLTSGNPGMAGYNNEEAYADNWNWGIPQVMGTLTNSVTVGHILSNISTSTSLNSNIIATGSIEVQINSSSVLSGLLIYNSILSVITSSSTLVSELGSKTKSYISGNTRSIVEDFNSYSGYMSTDSFWTIIRGSFYVQDGKIRNSQAVYRSIISRNGTFPSNQYSEIEFLGGPTDGYIGPAVRCIDAGNFYAAFTDGTGVSLRIYKYSFDSFSTIFYTSTLDTTIQPGDIVRLEINGNVISFLVNNNRISNVPDQIDNDLTSGNPGITGFNNYETYGDNWNWGIPQVIGTLTESSNSSIESLITTESVVSSNIKGNTNISSLLSLNSSITGILKGNTLLSSILVNNSQLGLNIKGIGNILSDIITSSSLIAYLMSNYELLSDITTSTNITLNILGKGKLLSIIDSSSTIQVTLTLKVYISSEITTNSSIVSTIKSESLLEAIINNSSSISGKLIANALIQSNISINSSLNIDIIGNGKLISSLNTLTIISSNINGLAELGSTVNGSTDIYATLSLVSGLNSHIYTDSNLLVDLKARANLSCYINDSTVSIGLLKALGSILTNINSYSTLDSRLLVSNILLLNQETFIITGPYTVTVDEDEIIEFKVIN